MSSATRRRFLSTHLTDCVALFCRRENASRARVADRRARRGAYRRAQCTLVHRGERKCGARRRRADDAPTTRVDDKSDVTARAVSLRHSRSSRRRSQRIPHAWSELAAGELIGRTRRRHGRLFTSHWCASNFCAVLAALSIRDAPWGAHAIDMGGGRCDLGGARRDAFFAFNFLAAASPKRSYPMRSRSVVNTLLAGAPELAECAKVRIVRFGAMHRCRLRRFP